ncbi:MAG TPA: magnesium chelatase, partial [bacterium]
MTSAKATGKPTLRTLGELKASGYQPSTIREEMRRNIIARLQAGQPLFPRIIGYEDSVVPKIENAVLAGHDMILLGERGQGKTRIIRALIELLDEYMPIVKGSEVNDSPFAPISRPAQELLAKHGDATEIDWVH